MNVQSGVEQAGSLIESLHRQASAYFAGNSDIEEPTAGDFWEKAVPDLEKALAVYDKMESPSTPDRTWIPFRESKEGCQKDLDKILDTVLAVLGICGASGYRTRIRNLQAENKSSQSRIAKYREQILSSSAADSQNFVEELVVPSKEALRDNIADETDRISARNQQIEDLKSGFREHLKQIGIDVMPETADSLLLRVEDDIVSMVAVTFRHSYRSLLIAIGAPLEVQKALLRHADLSTTDDYGGPPMEQKRKAHSRVVRKILSRKSSK
jgi:hypothetical protein